MLNSKCSNCMVVENNLGYEKKPDYNALETENKELKMVLRKFTHEMGNALTVLGASIFYVEGDMLRVGEKCDLHDLKNDYAYICNLFNNLREYNHAEAVDKKYIEINEVVREMDSSFHKIQGNESIMFGIYRHDFIENKKIFGDFVKLRQVFINVIKNAIEAVSENDAEKGKEIRISVTVEKDEGSYESIHKNDYDENNFMEMIHIEIIDNGKGISEKNICKIFEPMFTYGKKNGTGLGLSIVKKIIEDHQGKIKAVSALGTGTAIHIYLPVV